jgi:hypothetical protein
MAGQVDEEIWVRDGRVLRSSATVRVGDRDLHTRHQSSQLGSRVEGELTHIDYAPY